MKKRWIATGLAGALVLSGSGMAYQAYAEQLVEGQEVEVQEAIIADTSERVPEIQAEKKDVLQAKDSGETVPDFRESANLETSIEEPLLEPDPAVQKYNVDPASAPAEKKWLPNVLIEPDGTPTKPANAAIKDYGYGIVQYATYFANDGKQYYISQSEVEPSEGISFIQNAESTYKEPVRHIEIGGYAAVAVDGKDRRVVHILIDDQLLCVACWGLGAEELIAIAEQVVTRGQTVS